MCLKDRGVTDGNKSGYWSRERGMAIVLQYWYQLKIDTWFVVTHVLISQQNNIRSPWSRLKNTLLLIMNADKTPFKYFRHSQLEIIQQLDTDKYHQSMLLTKDSHINVPWARRSFKKWTATSWQEKEPFSGQKWDPRKVWKAKTFWIFHFINFRVVLAETLVILITNHVCSCFRAIYDMQQAKWCLVLHPNFSL